MGAWPGRANFGVIDEARDRQRRRWMRACVVIALATIVASTLMPKAGDGVSTLRGVARQPAITTVGCASVNSRPPLVVSNSTPHTLVSILGVLRQPATADDHQAAGAFTSFLRGLPVVRAVYIRYLRRLRTLSPFAGYYLIPVLVQPCREARPHDGICLLTWTRPADGGFAGSCGSSATTIEQGGSFASGGDSTGSTVQVVVPDGVRRVTLDYPGPAKVSYRSGKQGPSFTAAVMNNLALINVPYGAQRATNTLMLWRGPHGRVLKVIRKSPWSRP